MKVAALLKEAALLVVLLALSPSLAGASPTTIVHIYNPRHIVLTATADGKRTAAALQRGCCGRFGRTVASGSLKADETHLIVAIAGEAVPLTASVDAVRALLDEATFKAVKNRTLEALGAAVDADTAEIAAFDHQRIVDALALAENSDSSSASALPLFTIEVRDIPVDTATSDDSDPGKGGAAVNASVSNASRVRACARRRRRRRRKNNSKSTNSPQGWALATKALRWRGSRVSAALPHVSSKIPGVIWGYGGPTSNEIVAVVVQPNCRAARSGIRVGARVLEVNNVAVAPSSLQARPLKMEHFRSLIRRRQPAYFRLQWSITLQWTQHLSSGGSGDDDDDDDDDDGQHECRELPDGEADDATTIDPLSRRRSRS